MGWQRPEDGGGDGDGDDPDESSEDEGDEAGENEAMPDEDEDEDEDEEGRRAGEFGGMSVMRGLSRFLEAATAPQRRGDDAPAEESGGEHGVSGDDSGDDSDGVSDGGWGESDADLDFPEEGGADAGELADAECGGADASGGRGTAAEHGSGLLVETNAGEGRGGGAAPTAAGGAGQGDAETPAGGRHGWRGMNSGAADGGPAVKQSEGSPSVPAKQASGDA